MFESSNTEASKILLFFFFGAHCVDLFHSRLQRVWKCMVQGVFFDIQQGTGTVIGSGFWCVD